MRSLDKEKLLSHILTKKNPIPVAGDIWEFENYIFYVEKTYFKNYDHYVTFNQLNTVGEEYKYSILSNFISESSDWKKIT
jgi:hypothetical protein